MPGDRGLLVPEQRVREAQKDLAGAVAAKLTAESARDDEVIAGEGCHPGRYMAGTEFAGNDVMCRLPRPLLAKIRTHRRGLYSEQKENIIGAVSA